MCQAVALPRSEVPLALYDSPALADRVHLRADGCEPEVRSCWREVPAVLPVWLDGRVQVIRRGNRDRKGKLPPTGWTSAESAEAGRRAGLRPEPAVVPATYCLVGGTWYRVREGVRALVVRDRAGPAAHMVVERASRYFGVMTRSEWAPAPVRETVSAVAAARSTPRRPQVP